jgi:hypothetical protein
MDRFLISYRPILCHHAPGDGLAVGGQPAAGPAAPITTRVVAMETTAAFVCFDEKVSHGGSQ